MATDTSANIIIIEDDVGVARLQQKRLQRDGHRVHTFSQPEDAVPSIQRGEVDLMILDYRLPDNRTGLDFYESLKAAGYDLPAILVTGFSNEALIVKALRAGVKDFVSKSVEYLDYLPEAVAQVLHQSRVERRLAETEARFESIFHASPIATSVTTLDEGRYIDVNAAFLALHGLPATAVLGFTAQELGMIPENFDRVTFHQRMREARSIRDLPLTHRKRDGQLMELEASFELIRVRGQDVLLTMSHDVTERRKAEAALRESESRFQAFMNRSPAVAFLKDSDGRYLYVNATMLREFPSRVNDWVGRTDHDIFTPALALEFAKHDAQVLSARQAVEREELIEFRGAPPRNWLTLRFPVDDGSGQLLVGGLSIDITRRKRAEQLLKLQQRAMDATSEGILVTDPSQSDNPIVYVNQAFEQLTGYTSDEALGRNCRFLQGAETSAETLREIRAALDEGRPVSAEILNYRRDAQTFWNLLSITPVRDDGGDITHFVGVQRDITERKLIAEQMRQSQKMEAIGRLAGGVAHDFNNLLTIVLGNAELALEDLPDENPNRELLQEIAHAGQRAASLTTQLLAFSRKQVLEPRVLDLNDLVASTDRLLRRLIGEDIYLSTVLDPMLHRVKVDPVQVEQILLNLTVNARDAMPDGGNLTIETRNTQLEDTFGLTREQVRSGRYVMLAVTDTGHGMDEATRARIFEPFFTTKERGKGTGMGLPTVYGIVQQSGGYLWVYSEVGKGTTFKIYFPEHLSGPLLPVADPVLKSNLRGNETVLLVEDEAMVRALAKRILESQGYRVLEAEHGEAALTLSQAYPHPIDLLVTDVIMPGVSGRQLAEQILVKRPELRVLYISGYTDNTISHHGVLDPEVAFLQKPFTHELLATKVRQVLNQPRDG
ncbi:MAG TPA: PAS domain S-box protein [Pirellulaceae bacterium]|nr:PAS domain S-box protein [Pirellulaceae bacterium]